MVIPDMTEKMLRKHIRKTVQAVEASAECILFGSRARGDAHEDANWDIVVLVDGDITETR